MSKSAIVDTERMKEAVAFYAQAENYGESRQLKEALDACNKGLVIYPLSCGYYVKAWALQELGRFHEALENYDIAIQLDPEDQGAHINKGCVLARLGRYEEAVAANDRAIELSPNDFNSHNNRGLDLRKLGRYEESLASFDRAQQINPDNPDVYYSRGNSLRDLGRHEEALEAYNRAIGLSPNDAMCICNKANLLLIMNRDQEALDCLTEAHRLIEQGIAQEETPEHAAFVQQSLSKMGDLLQKVAELQKSSMETEALVGEYGSEEAKEELSHLKQDRISIFGQALSDAGGRGDAPSGDNADLVARLNLITAQYEALRTRLDTHEVAIATHDAAIVDINAKIKSLELSQQQMQQMFADFVKHGIKNAQEFKQDIISLLYNLNAKVTGEVPPYIAQDPYKNAFYNSLQRDLNATYVAAMTVQTDIVENSKTSPLLGKMGSILSVAGQYIPTLGGGVMILGAILSTVDQNQQKILVKRFAEMASSTTQMDSITSHIAEMLAQDEFTDTLEEKSDSLLSGYLISFLQGIFGAKSVKAVAHKMAVDALQNMGVSIAESAITKTPTKSKIFGLKKISIFKKKAAADDRDQEEVKLPSTEKSQGEKDAHMVSAIIISKIYKGEISADGTLSNTAKLVVCEVLTHFELGAGMIESLTAGVAHHHHGHDITFALLAAEHDHQHDDDHTMTLIGE